MEREGTIRKLAAILSADVKEYSRLMSQDERGTIRTLTSYKEAMSKLIEVYKGRVVDAPGDNLLAEFGSVVDAVNCAVEIQRELAERNADLPPARQMEFRIGINLGDIVEEEKRIYGDGVNIAARVEGLADGGGICISSKVHDEVKNKLGLEYEYLGEQEVKNIPEPVGVYRVLSFPGAAAHRVVKAKTAMKKKWRNISLAVTAVLIIGIGLSIWHFYFRPPPIEPADVKKMAYTLPEEPSIAVLPFVNISGDPKEDYIADGITESIITALSKTPKMFVIARNTVFTYKGKAVKVKQASEDLGVRYVLEGSVQKEGNRLRINAQLIDAIKGHHLWAEKYDMDIKDLFALQDEITMKVITELQVKLTEGTFARLQAKDTNNIEAFLKCLQAVQLIRTFNKENNHLAREILKEGIALDPNYPVAYIYMGWAHAETVRFGWSKSPKKSLALAEEFIKKALKLDESHSHAHTHLSIVYHIKKQWDKALAENERAVSLDPNSMSLGTMAFTLLKVGRPKEAIVMFNKAIRLDPIPPGWMFTGLGMSYFMVERYKDAIEPLKHLLERAKKGEYNPLSPNRSLAMVYAMLGQENQARDHVEEVLRIDPKYTLTLHKIMRFLLL